MKKLMIVSALLFSFAAPAFAVEVDWAKDPKWQGEGWYVTLSSLMGANIESGPYATQEAAEGGLPSEAVQDEAIDNYGLFYGVDHLPK